MKKYKWVKPYLDKGIGAISNFRAANKRPGVYLIKEDSEIVYVGYSATDLYRTMSRHFQVWNDKRMPRVTYWDRLDRYVYKVRVVFCTSAQAQKLEKMLILKYEPRDNYLKYDQIDLTAGFWDVLEKYDAIPVEREVPF